MTLEIMLTLGIFLLTLLCLFLFQSRPAMVFGGTLLALLLCGVASQEQLIASVANSGLLTLLLLIISSLALEKTHLLRLISTKMMDASYSKSWLRLFFGTAFSSALLNNTAIVATLLSSVRNNPHHSSARLLISLSYAAILGGTLTLIGTSTNLIINSLLIDASNTSFDFFTFTPLGLCLLMACGLTLWFSHKSISNEDFNAQNSQGYFIDAKVEVDSPLVNRSIEDNGLRHLQSLFLVELMRDGRLITPVSPDEIIKANDKLIFSGDISQVMQLTQLKGLTLFADLNGLLQTNLTEVVIRESSILNGNSIKKVGFRALFGAAVVAIRRDGERLSGKLGEIKLKAGDFLVLAVGQDFKTRNNINKNFILLSGVEPEGKLDEVQSWLIVISFLAMIIFAALGLIKLLTALCIYIGLLLFTGVLTINEITRRLPVNIWLIVSSALLLSQTLISTGTTQLLLSIIAFDVTTHPYLTLIVLYFCTCLITELITNNASVALMFPIAWTLASSADINHMPLMLTVAFAASASFISPYGYQTNLMVFNAGGYRIKDYVKVGLPVSLVYALVVILLVPYFYPF